MVDLAIGVITQAILKMVISLASEEICLAWGMQKDLNKLAGKLEMIQALLFDAQRNQVNSEAVRVWLKSLGSIALDAQIVLEEIGYEVLRQKVKSRKRDKVRNLFSSNNPALFHRKMAHKIKDVLSSFEELYIQSKELNLVPIPLENSLPDLKDIRLTDPFVEESKIVGREDDTLKVINFLTESEYEGDLPVITIMGMGGQGKTTLAQLIYNNDKVKSYFDKTIWICVSDDFSVERLLSEMLQSLTGRNEHLTNTEALVNKLRPVLHGKRYLLVLDDVWNDNRELWDRMRSCLLGIGGSKGSRVLATTRREDVASAMRTCEYHRLQKLSEDQSWSLFERCVFAEGGARKTPQFIEVGKQILKRCGGVPLAIKTIGGLLYSKKSEEEWLIIERSNWWSADSEERMVLSAIKLSYDHLPSLPIKQCFAHCSIFEKDRKLSKDMLIEFWMAQGLLNPHEGSSLQMEDMGERYFYTLLRNSLLEYVQEHDRDKTRHYKMHDLVHDVSLQVMGNCCHHVKDGEVESNKIEAVHVSVGERRTLYSLKDILSSKLRTLHLKDGGAFEDFFERFRYLSALIIQNRDVKELPNSIGKMKHLRLLDIYDTSIKQLPKSFTKLYYLQTLRVRGLEEVPEGFGNLINLRHIHMKKCWYSKLLFPGISQLRNLQTLPHFKVDRRDGCRIEELEHMGNLRGTLRILSLQNVVNYESAVKSNLAKKLNIQNLELQWDWRRKEEGDDCDVLEGLKPHLHLTGLNLEGYQSSKFPSWMIKDDHVLRLRNLVTLWLSDLDKCERLPSLGDLPCLEELRIIGLTKVRSIGEEFYGWSNLEWISSNDSETITLFPALKTFWLEGMESLVEWSNPVGIIPATRPELSSLQINAFPNLTDMRIYGVRHLNVFPNLGSLPSLERLDVSRCKNLTICASEWNQMIRSSQELDINVQGHSSLDGDSDIQYFFKSLKQLTLQSCEKLTKPICSLINNSSTPLENLCIFCHPDSLPDDLPHLSSLRVLHLGVEQNITELDQVECYPWPFRTSGLVSLTSLYLYGHNLPNVTYLPDQIKGLTRLDTLVIFGFEKLEALLDWMGEIVCLQHLFIINCKSIKQLPSVEAFQRLVNLRTVWIDRCPLLEERCTEGSGSEWPKISHIPNIAIFAESPFPGL